MKLQNRDGTVVVLTAVLLPLILLLAAFVINLSYVQLANTELKVATDAAARAGGRALSAYQDLDDAKEAAQITAALNSVGGRSLQLDTSSSSDDIQFGDSHRESVESRFSFTATSGSSVEQFNSIKISGKLGNGSQNDSLTAIFPSFGLPQDYSLQSNAVAMQLDRDIALVLDRSGSMQAVDYSFPSGYNPWWTSSLNAAVDEGIIYKNNGYYYYSYPNNQYEYFLWLYEDYWELGSTAPFRSKWGHLVDSVDVFLQVLETTDQHEFVSVTTYSSSAQLDLDLSHDYDSMRSLLDGVYASGMTGIGRGISTGMDTLTGASARPFAAKTMVVMTDGIHNSGQSPIDAAEDAVAELDVTIHTVTFGSGADQSIMQEVAEIGGGQHYHANSGAELREVFETIANNLPTLIVE